MPRFRLSLARGARPHQPGRQRGRLPWPAQQPGHRPDQGGADQPGRNPVPGPAWQGAGRIHHQPRLCADAADRGQTISTCLRCSRPNRPRRPSSRAGPAVAFEIHFPKRFTLWLKAAAHTAQSRFLPARGPDRRMNIHPVTTTTRPHQPPRLMWHGLSIFESSSPETTWGNWLSCTTATPASLIRSTTCTALPAIEAIFRHMFVALEAPRFVVTGQRGARRSVLLAVGLSLPLQAL